MHHHPFMRGYFWPGLVFSGALLFLLFLGFSSSRQWLLFTDIETSGLGNFLPWAYFARPLLPSCSPWLCTSEGQRLRFLTPSVREKAEMMKCRPERQSTC